MFTCHEHACLVTVHISKSRTEQEGWRMGRKIKLHKCCRWLPSHTHTLKFSTHSGATVRGKGRFFSTNPARDFHTESQEAQGRGGGRREGGTLRLDRAGRGARMLRGNIPPALPQPYRPPPVPSPARGFPVQEPPPAALPRRGC